MTPGVAVAEAETVAVGVTVCVVVGAGKVGAPHEGLSRVASPIAAGVQVASGDGVEETVGTGAAVRVDGMGDDLVGDALGGAATVQAIKISNIRPARNADLITPSGA